LSTGDRHDNLTVARAIYGGARFSISERPGHPVRSGEGQGEKRPAGNDAIKKKAPITRSQGLGIITVIGGGNLNANYGIQMAIAKPSPSCVRVSGCLQKSWVAGAMFLLAHW
jgi:hypothetical protein